MSNNNQYIRVQKNFYIRLRDRMIWARAYKKAIENGIPLYETITLLLKKWIDE